MRLRGFQAAGAAEITVTADSPQDHLHEDAFVDLDEQVFDQAASGIGFEQGERWAAIEAGMRIRKPGERAFAAAIDRLGEREDANCAKDAIGLFEREALAARAAVLEGAQGDDD